MSWPLVCTPIDVALLYLLLSYFVSNMIVCRSSKNLRHMFNSAFKIRLVGTLLITANSFYPYAATFHTIQVVVVCI